MRIRHGRGKEKLYWVSTSYGGMTRVRFGGFFPRVGKSRLHGREAPLSCAPTVAGDAGGAKWEFQPAGHAKKPGRLVSGAAGGLHEFLLRKAAGWRVAAPVMPIAKRRGRVEGLARWGRICKSAAFSTGFLWPAAARRCSRPLALHGLSWLLRGMIEVFEISLKNFLIRLRESTRVRPCTGRSSAW